MSAEYAICVDCEVTFADRDEAQTHGHDTMSPTGERGVIARGHAWRVVNPTPEEQAKSRIRQTVSDAIETALYDAIEDLISSVERGDITAEQVADELRRYPDFCEAWDEAEL